MMHRSRRAVWTRLFGLFTATVAALVATPLAWSQDPVFERVAVYTTGRWPKQVIFTPDGERILVPLLEGDGFDVISLMSNTVERRTVPGFGHHRSFPEGVFSASGERFFLSQMPTGRVHVFSSPGLELQSSASSHGTFPKWIALSPDQAVLAVSNWITGDVALLDGETLALIQLLKVAGAETPRGMAFTPDGNRLVIGYFGSGHIVLVDTATWQPTNTIHIGGAPRHVVVETSGRLAYVSDMARRRVVVLDIAAARAVAWIPVGANPNTMDLTPDGRYLLVSSRGPNDPVDYKRRSPEDGHIYVIRTADREVVAVIPGGNQPTGLDVSPTGDLFAFSNFQDNTVEVYRITY